MAGGKGERFWPRSREKTPKQLQKVYSDKTLLEETLLRARSITDLAHIYIGCNAGLKKSILAQLGKKLGLGERNFIVEPEAKNTAAIVALAALRLQEIAPDQVQVVLSADHFISPIDDFRFTITKAIEAAQKGYLVTLGVRPSRPETGYGYIDSGDEGDGFFTIRSFVEKPNLALAVEYLRSGRHYWNSGIFIWSPDTIVAEFERYAPQILEPIRASLNSKGGLKKAFTEIRSEPVDTAILEKSSKIVMIPATFTWDDVGSWLSLERICPADDYGNIHVSSDKKSKMIVRDSEKNIVVSSRPLVALLGLRDVVVIEEGDVLLISNREGLGDIKGLLSDMRENRALHRYLL